MAITLVQSTELTVSNTSITGSFSSNTTAGNTIVAAICDWPSTSAVTFTGPTGFTETTNVDYGASGFNDSVNSAYFYQNTITGGTENYTFTGSGGYPWLGLGEFSNLSIAGVDWNVTYQQVSGTSYTMTGNAPAASGELIVAGVFTASGNSLNYTTPSGWNLFTEYPNGTSTGNTRGAVFWQISGSSAPVCNFVYDSSDYMSFNMIAYTNASTPAGVTAWLFT